MKLVNAVDWNEGSTVCELNCWVVQTLQVAVSYHQQCTFLFSFFEINVFVRL